MPMYSTEICKCNGRLRTKCLKIVNERREGDRERKEKRKEGKFRMPKRYQTFCQNVCKCDLIFTIRETENHVE